MALLPDDALAHVDRELEAGQIVGEYQIEGKLGEGGFGAVYRAVHPLIGKHAAVKVLSREFSANPQMVSRFVAEARAVNHIRHKNIIDIFSFGQLPDGRQYYVMELLDGMPFDKYLAQHGRLSVGDAIPILLPLGRALDAAHAKGILHRDLKPENVFLVFEEDGTITPKLLDFGLVKLLAEKNGNHKTKTGTPMGTPYYMSPEQCRGLDVDARTDVYSFGAMVFEVLTGEIPFDGDSAMDILVKHMTAEPPSASTLVPELPNGIDAPLRRMLAKEPGQRPASIAEALSELSAAGGKPIPAATPSHRHVVGANTSAAAMMPTALDLSSGAGKNAQTFLGAEADVVPPASRGRSWMIAVGAIAFLLGGVGAVFALRGPTPAASTGNAVQSASNGPAPVASASSPPTASLVAPAPVPVITDVEVRVEGAPPKAKVLVEGKELGEAPGPFKLKRGEAVKMTVTAKGFKAREVSLTPTENVLVPVSLDRETPAAARKNPARPSDLPSFD
ncbi:serine/threonine protein kinase [Labilithrix luteola]|uniref:Serine/threonine protein kinase n=1 Tax=Labilithrix luteola TaxID=1391654 RepID=A0A0K1Q9U3_9BACT|nr:serine/threonine protein kinase [Labilithrix luteola]